MLYRQHRKLLRPAAREANALGEGVTVIGTPLESEALTRSRYPSIIISASGMATG